MEISATSPSRYGRLTAAKASVEHLTWNYLYLPPPLGRQRRNFNQSNSLARGVFSAFATRVKLPCIHSFILLSSWHRRRLFAVETLATGAAALSLLQGPHRRTAANATELNSHCVRSGARTRDLPYIDPIRLTFWKKNTISADCNNCQVL